MPPTRQPVLETTRLILRPRTPDDLQCVAAMNADPEVMRWIAPAGYPFMGLEGLAQRSFSHVARGLGYWSVVRREMRKNLIGYVGLIPYGPDGEAIELSYRFERAHWGRGHAFEASERLLRHCFEGLVLPEVAVFTHPENAGSLRLAERLGFNREADRRSWLMGDPEFSCAYLRLSREAWERRAMGAGVAASVTPPEA